MYTKQCIDFLKTVTLVLKSSHLMNKFCKCWCKRDWIFTYRKHQAKLENYLKGVQWYLASCERGKATSIRGPAKERWEKWAVYMCNWKELRWIWIQLRLFHSTLFFLQCNFSDHTLNLPQQHKICPQIIWMSFLTSGMSYIIPILSFS